MLLDQVLDADSDEPPNFRSLLLLFLMSLCANTAGCAAMNYDTVIKDSVRGEVVAEKVEYAGQIEDHSQARSKGSRLDEIRILALILDDTNSKKGYNEGGVISVYENNPIFLHLVGHNFSNLTKVKFTTANNTYGGSCRGEDGESHFQSDEMVPIVSEDPDFARLEILAGLESHVNDEIYFLCVEDPVSKNFIHQGHSKQLQMELKPQFLPHWLMIVFIFVCLCLSGLFSGLNLGLMSLDQTELKIVMSTGTDQEKDYANRILPVRALGNFLLCSILLGNVLVNNTLTIMLDIILGGGGMGAVIGSTLAIVVFGEIIPQAICSRHGLAVGAHTIILTKLFMLITSPLSWPISKLLDLLLGSEIGTVYNKERLMELLKVTDQYNDLEKDEVNIVTGALVLKQKCVKDVMTRLDDCYMLPLESILDFETVSEIKAQGYSRIPVYEKERTNIVYILFAKDLLFIDPDDKKPMEEVCKFYKNAVNLVYDDTVLTDMFNEFKSGEKGHLAVVQEINTDTENDPFYETVGIVTLEDIIEEIIQSEIIDETDVIIDNKSKKKRTRDRYKKDADFKMFLGNKTQRVSVSPQMSLAILQYLTTSVRPFSPENCSQSVLQHLLKMDVFREINLSKRNSAHKLGKEGGQSEPKTEGIIMSKGVPCDYFVLIVEGKVEVTIGKENKTFQEGPFSCFGEQLLDQVLLGPASPSIASNLTERSHQSRSGYSWVPDYTLRAVTDVVFLKVRKNTYSVAIKSSRLNNMNSESEGPVMREEDIKDVLVKVTENDADFNCQTPEKIRSSGQVSNLRSSSLRRSLSSLRFMLYDRSTTSIEKAKDEAWDGLENQALNRSEEDVGKAHKTAEDIYIQHLNGFGRTEDQGGIEEDSNNVIENHKTVISIGVDDSKIGDYEPLSITATAPTDRTSLLKSEHSLS